MTTQILLQTDLVDSHRKKVLTWKIWSRETNKPECSESD